MGSEMNYLLRSFVFWGGAREVRQKKMQLHFAVLLVIIFLNCSPSL